MAQLKNPKNQTAKNAMPLPTAPTRRPSNPGSRQADRKANASLLAKAILCVLTGLGMGVSPHFITSPGLHHVLTLAAPVGWGVLALGCALIGWYVWRRTKKLSI